MATEVWLAFVLASLVLLVIPGPTVITLLNYSLRQGRRATWALVVAVALGDATALCLSLLGLGALLATSSFWFTTLKWIGGMYLIYLGLRFMLGAKLDGASPAAATPESAEHHSPWSAFWNTYLVTALNPKGLVFFVAFLPQFIDPVSNPNQQLWILATTFVILATLSAACYVVTAQRARQLIDSAKIQQGLSGFGGAILLIAGLWSLTAERNP